jgi:hypothetical protein
MSIQTNIKKYGKYRFTSDGLFAIEPVITPGYLPSFQTDSIYLYIKTEIVSNILNENSPLANMINNKIIILDELEPTKQLTMKFSGLDVVNNYNKYIFHRKFIDERKYTINDEGKNLPNSEDTKSLNENDCLKFGECMTTVNQTGDINKFNQMIKLGESDPVLEFKNLSNAKFGNDDEGDENRQFLKKIPKTEKNNNAIPEKGESYAIVRKKPIENEADYHIAFVLYTHQNINITLEAAADQGNEYYPRFCFYDINPNELTFHKVNSRGYLNGETVVLKKSRDINTILKEIDKEIAKNNKNQAKNNNNMNFSKKRKFGSGKRRRIVYIKKKMTKRKGKATNKNKNKKSIKKH